MPADIIHTAINSQVHPVQFDCYTYANFAGFSQKLYHTYQPAYNLEQAMS
jgi:hypothetical protein